MEVQGAESGPGGSGKQATSFADDRPSLPGQHLGTRTITAMRLSSKRKCVRRARYSMRSCPVRAREQHASQTLNGMSVLRRWMVGCVHVDATTNNWLPL